MIEELLERRQDLFDIAALLYGDSFITCKEFWGSPTERDLAEVYEQLYKQGYKFPDPSKEQLDEAKKIARDMDLGFEFED